MIRRGYEKAHMLSSPHVNNIEYTESVWRSVQLSWSDFVHDGIIPESGEWLRPEIIDSWTRCKDMGVDYEATDVATPLSAEEYSSILQRYSGLIDIARSSMDIIEDLHLDNDYIFEFVSTSGVTLCRVGNMDLHSIVAQKSVMDESTMGTNAHSLSIRYATPMMVMGPEHYCGVLHGLAAIAAPVFDENGIVVGSLLLTQPLQEQPWNEDYQRLLLHALGLISSIASSIEQQLVAREGLAAREVADERLKRALAASSKTQHVLDIAIGSSDDAILVADASGVVQHASPEAVHVLRATMESLIGVSLETIFGIAWPNDFMAMTEAHRTDRSVKVGTQLLSIRGYAVYDAEHSDLDGFVVRIASLEAPKASSHRKRTGDAAMITFEDIMGSSKVIRKAEKLAQRYAMTMENVLIVGESGTGKEYFAQAIHNASRPSGPFMSLNCAAIPDRLIESELFGYESGAFTGADRAGKPGKIELADNGTLFLDEIGDMPLELQATLLRVLENKRVMRLGGKAYHQVDFRVIAATNRSLPKMVEEGTFREDLFYRLSILTVSIPPLRMRNGDIMLFAYHYLNECRRKAHGGPSKFSDEAERLIKEYPWPGNVRQMKNAVYSAFYATLGEEIGLSDLPAYLRNDDRSFANGFDGASQGVSSATVGEGASSDPLALGQDRMSSDLRSDGPNGRGIVSLPEDLLRLSSVEEYAIKLALVYAEGNVTKAASILQIGKATLYRKIKEYGLK